MTNEGECSAVGFKLDFLVSKQTTTYMFCMSVSKTSSTLLNKLPRVYPQLQSLTVGACGNHKGCD